ncbi:MAG: hypothetical protein JSW11_17020 [Candidatus Heimdallarchaeota archaeon]|nr:MAG: hypothetical protein JSW11_17020 [Candidatus Heimdallarchaeota archaeon]
MTYNSIFSTERKISQEIENQKELQRLLSLKGITSEKVVKKTWILLKKMQKELHLPTLYPIKQHYHFYLKLDEIQKILNHYLDFSQLNQLFNELTALRDLLGLPETASISKIITTIWKEPLERLVSLDMGYDSLLLKILMLNSTTKDSTKTQKGPSLTHDLDFTLLSILKAYGPLSRPELVQLAGAPRSTIYDSLQRLITRGFAVQYTKKKNPVGRPVTLFDALI